MRTANGEQRGFSLAELLVAVAVFTVLMAAIFAMLNQAQQRYRAESDALDSFQSGRMALDQITRDIHCAGYPPQNSLLPSVAAANPQKYALPFGWTPNYPGTACTVNSNCAVPNAYDLIVEADVGSGVQWIRYQLSGTTLMRAVVNKTAGTDPATATASSLSTYIENVMNNPGSSQMTFLKKYYPGMFPGNYPYPLFIYGTDAAGVVTSLNIRTVSINLVMMAPNVIPGRQPRVVSLSGLAITINPNQ